MAQFMANKVAKHVLKEGASNRFGTDDPYFEYVAPTDVQGNVTGKPKKQKRGIPPGLTSQEAKVLKKVTRRAHRLDNCMNFCGIKVGWSAVIGLVPAIGDMIDAFMALMVVWTCTKAGIPDTLKSRMMFNIVLDFAVGLVPFLGDIADALYRCNTRNAALLYKHLEARGAERLRNGQRPEEGLQQPPVAATQHQTHHPHADRSRPATSRDDRIQREPNEKTSAAPASAAPASAATASQKPRHVTAGDLEKLEPAKPKSNEKAGQSGWRKWLGSFEQPQRDVEHDGAEMSQRR